jgi:hypothetical protein
MMARPGALNLAVLLVFIAAQAESLDHRVRHAAEEAAEDEASFCPFGEETVHLCADRADAGHDSGCALCLAGTALVDPSVSGPGPSVPPLEARAHVLGRDILWVAPDAGLSDPRGPPSL